MFSAYRLVPRPTSFLRAPNYRTLRTSTSTLRKPWRPYGHIPEQMTAGLMRRLFSSSTRARILQRLASNQLRAPPLLGLKQYQRTITDVRPRQASVSRTWFTSTAACPSPDPDGSSRPPDERTLKLGKSRFCTPVDMTSAWFPALTDLNSHTRSP
jgi:hypothetical protein